MGFTVYALVFLISSSLVLVEVLVSDHVPRYIIELCLLSGHQNLTAYQHRKTKIKLINITSILVLFILAADTFMVS